MGGAAMGLRADGRWMRNRLGGAGPDIWYRELMRGPKASALEHALELARRAGRGQPGSSIRPATLRSPPASDPELESLIGLIRQRRARHVVGHAELPAATPTGTASPIRSTSWSAARRW
jgi:hypothetical protein